MGAGTSVEHAHNRDDALHGQRMNAIQGAGMLMLRCALLCCLQGVRADHDEFKVMGNPSESRVKPLWGYKGARGGCCKPATTKGRCRDATGATKQATSHHKTLLYARGPMGRWWREHHKQV